MTSSTTSNLVTASKPSTSVTFTAPLLPSSATLTAQSQQQIRPPPPRSATNPNYPPIFLGKSVNNGGGGGAPTTPSFYPSVGHNRPLYPRPIPDRTVTVANPNHGGGGYIRNPASISHAGMTATPPPPPPQQVVMPGPHLSMRAPLQQPFLGLRQNPASHKNALPPVPGSGPQLKNAPSPGATMVSEKILNEREKNMEEAVMMVHGRKVRFSEENSDSLYALCRSWVRNGYYHDNQPKAGDSLKILPKPLPAKSLQVTSEDVIKIDKDLGCAEQLAEDDLLKGHIKRAKMIRSQLRKERMSRIERYKQRLSILLPTQSELMARNEATP